MFIKFQNTLVNLDNVKCIRKGQSDYGEDPCIKINYFHDKNENPIIFEFSDRLQRDEEFERIETVIENFYLINKEK